MLLDQETLRFIFGLKLRGLRLDRGLSLKELSKKTGLSPSYLNEIEKGKKHPKNEKIMVLAHALNEPYEDLISLKLKKELSLVSHLIEKNIFSGMPFDIFGVPASMVFELIAERPKKMGAFIGTLLELARVHDISIDDFFYATLRAYLDMHENYFPGIEEKVLQFQNDFELPSTNDLTTTIEQLRVVLQNDFGVAVRFERFSNLNESLKGLYYFVKRKSSGGQILYVNTDMPIREHSLILAREIGFQYLRVKTRPQTSNISNLDSFEQLFHHFSASYFGSALLIGKDALLYDLKTMFETVTWDASLFKSIVEKYPTPYESVFHRMTQLIPRFMGLNHIFFLRFDYARNTNAFKMVRELHLSALHSPHRVDSDEHYCRRWLTTRLLSESYADNAIAGAQISKFMTSGNEYLNLSFAHKDEPNGSKSSSFTLGILINEKLNETAQFLSDPTIPRRDVGETCERCTLISCEERAAPLNPDRLPNKHDLIIKTIDLLEDL